MEERYLELCKLFGLDAASPLSEKQIEEIRDYFGGLPKALESYYRICGGCSGMNSAQDFLLTADKTYHYDLKKWECGDYCVFYVENQCVSVWAFKKSDIDKDDPPVYETYDGGKTWFLTCDRLSQYLISHAYLNAVFSFEYSDEDVIEADGSHAKAIAEEFPHVDADSGLYTGVKFYQPFDDTVIAVMNNDEEGYQVFFSSRSEEHLEETADILYPLCGYEE